MNLKDKHSFRSNALRSESCSGKSLSGLPGYRTRRGEPLTSDWAAWIRRKGLTSDWVTWIQESKGWTSDMAALIQERKWWTSDRAVCLQQGEGREGVEGWGDDELGCIKSNYSQCVCLQWCKWLSSVLSMAAKPMKLYSLTKHLGNPHKVVFTVHEKLWKDV